MQKAKKFSFTARKALDFSTGCMDVYCKL